MTAARSFPRLAHGEPVDELGLVLRLLDHQVVGTEGRLVGNVEDLVLERLDGDVVVVGLVLGTEGWARRQPGLIGHWVVSVWRRLHRQEDPRPTTLALRHVLHLDSAVHVDDTATRWALATSDLERWLRRHVVAPLPGSGVSGDDDRDAPDEEAPEVAPAPLEEPGRLRLSEVLGAAVVDSSGAAHGRVIEVHATPTTVRGDAALRLVSLTHGNHLVGSGLGYGDASHAGPVVFAALVRWWHRHDRVTRWDDVVELSVGAERQVRVTRR